MPYKITSFRPPYRYINQVPRDMLATEIIKQLVALDFTLSDFHALIQDNHLSDFHIMDSEAFARLIKDHPEMDFIYSDLRLQTGELIHFHTNWTVSKTEWMKLASALANHKIKVETIPGHDTRIRSRSKEAI